MKRILKIDAADNVAVALEPLAPGDEALADGETVTVLSVIPVPHKIALRDLAPGELVIKYGEAIGYATCPIRKGELVHVHNLDSEKLMA